MNDAAVLPLSRGLHRLAPLLARIRPRLGLSNDYRATASRSWTISPPFTTRSPQAIFDPADLARIIATSAEGNLPTELERVTTDRQVTHGPTTAHELRHALILDGHLFTAQAAHSVAWSKPPAVAWHRLPLQADAVLASTAYGVKYFAHWLHDDLPLTLAARAIGHPVSLLDRPTDGQRSYLDILGLQTPVRTYGFYERLVVIHDSAENASKRERYLRLRERAAAGVAGHAPPAVPAPPGVMILRGASGAARRLVNESELAAGLERQGWRVLDPARHTPAEMIGVCSRAPIVLGVEGSQLGNGMMWMPAGGCLVVIQPPQRFVTILKNQCDALAIRYAFIVADRVGETDFRLDPGGLATLLDRVAADRA